MGGSTVLPNTRYETAYSAIFAPAQSIREAFLRIMQFVRFAVFGAHLNATEWELFIDGYCRLRI